ncbi:MAG: hypothetical protein KDA21_01095 [Phycisphaerales bacterium]|nr:hypothetical protein [Phycisphaerales bacterium]
MALAQRMVGGIALSLLASSALAQIVNINALTTTPVTLSLDAGAYRVLPINSAGGGLYDAWLAWDVVNCSDPQGCAATAPTTVMGWINRYAITSSEIAAASAGGLPLAPVSSAPTLPASPYSHFLVSGSTRRVVVWDGYVYPTSGPAFAAADVATFTLASASSVVFSHLDPLVTDNEGGMSLRVERLPACPGDADFNGVVNFTDLTILLEAWGTDEAAADFNGDGLVNFADLNSLLDAWGQVCG